MSIIRDEFILGQSQTKSLSNRSEAIRLDLSLSPNPYLNAGSILGRVTDSSGKPISDAVVIVLDETYTAVAKTLSGTDGLYVLSPVTEGSNYRVCSQASGYLLSDTQLLTVEANQTYEVNLSLIPDSQPVGSIIAGEVKNSDKLPILYATIELYEVAETSTALVSVSYSNTAGQFILQDLDCGSYFLKINASGYFIEFLPVDIHEPHTIELIEAVLRENPKASKGVVTGLVTSSDDEPLPNADVILYRVEADHTLSPVDSTKTNQEGIYLFVNVPNGEYRVNSNRTIVHD